MELIDRIYATERHIAPRLYGRLNAEDAAEDETVGA